MKKKFKNLIISMFIASFALMGVGFNGVNTTNAASPLAVNLGTASNFSILAETAITTTGATSIVGNIGISPAAVSNITGFGQTMDSSNTFSTSTVVTGKIYAADYVAPTPANMTTAVSAMEAAYTDAAGRPNPTATEVDSGILSSTTPAFVAGIYKWGTGVTITDHITLSGSANDVWIFQVAGDLDLAAAGSVASGTKILLTGGAKAENVFWQVGGLTGATLGTYSTFNGNILSAKQIRLRTGALLNGRAFSQTQVTLDTNTISSSPATLHVIKLVVNDVDGTATSSDFNISVKKSDVDVAGSPMSGTSTPGTLYSLAPGTYVVNEDANSSYTKSFSGDCDSSGSVTLAAGDDKTCTIINTNIPVSVVVATSTPTSTSTSTITTTPIVSSGNSGGASPVLPLIGITKIPSPLFLSAPGSVTYNYTVWNVGGQQALASVKVIDDKCGPVTLVSGDLNKNFKIEPSEVWKYSCTTTLSKTTTNTVVATAKSDDPYQQTAIATAIATVVVGSSTTPIAITATSTSTLVAPLINIIKVPSRLTPFPVGGGNVTYTYTVTNPGIVAMNNVKVTDDKCSPVSKISGDVNNDKILNVGEKWIYTCQTKVAVSTRNTAMAKGYANGFVATGYAFATVIVSSPISKASSLIPKLPNTGIDSQSRGASWNIIIASGVLLIAFISLLLVLKKRKD
jgi:hypothetical protein